MDRLGVALSGGGHRASLFGLGVLTYLVDAEKHREVVSIASVSGGSITNGFVAQQLEYADCTRDDFKTRVAAPLTWQIAQRGTLFAPLASKLYLVALAVSVIATLVGPWLLPLAWWWKVAAFVVAVAATAWIAGQRGNVCGAAYRKTLFSPGGSATRIRTCLRRASPVWCATDLRTARQVYFGSRFVYGYTLGRSDPGELPLHKAVQASAAFPGGFPPTRISTRPLEFRDPRTDEVRGGPRQLVLVDGGVYDNMADQWARGFADRLRRWPDLSDIERQPDTLIVVNSSARRDWMPFRARIPVWGELAALLRDMSVLYENTTAVRRQDLVEHFDEAERGGRGMRGCLVMIGQSPYTVADYYARADQREEWPERAERGDAVLALLGENRQIWKRLVADDSDVPTTLAALGVDRSARLLYHAYVVAMCNAHVVLGYPLLTIPELERFRALARG